MLQWGRTFSSAEKGKLPIACSYKLTIFNGAALFQVRKKDCGVCGGCQAECFNGAALFQVRKTQVDENTAGKFVELQWGRTFSSAEKPPTLVGFQKSLIASMGPHFFKCGKNCARIQHGLTDGASMGPHFFKCGKVGGWQINRLAVGASMGPHFFKCGKRLAVGKSIGVGGWASMGPHFFKCGKSPRAAANAHRNKSFNGAALFQVRKKFSRSRDVAPLACFNGAALFQVRKI